MFRLPWRLVRPSVSKSSGEASNGQVEEPEPTRDSLGRKRRGLEVSLMSLETIDRLAEFLNRRFIGGLVGLCDGLGSGWQSRFHFAGRDDLF